MLWNFCLHIVIGVLGNNIFTFTSSGLLECFAIAMFTQAIDTIRIYYETKKRIEHRQLVKEREEHMNHYMKNRFIILPQLAVMKAIFYGIVTLASAYVARTML